MQVTTTAIVLGAGALGAIAAVIIGRASNRGATAGRASRWSHILSGCAMLLLAAFAFVDAAIGSRDRYLLIAIGVVLVVTSLVVLRNSRKLQAP